MKIHLSGSFDFLEFYIFHWIPFGQFPDFLFSKISKCARRWSYLRNLWELSAEIQNLYRPRLSHKSLQSPNPLRCGRQHNRAAKMSGNLQDLSGCMTSQYESNHIYPPQVKIDNTGIGIGDLDRGYPWRSL